MTLFAYLDEFGHIGPYIGRQHPRYKESPVFGLAGFVLPAEAVRGFGAEQDYDGLRVINPFADA